MENGQVEKETYRLCYAFVDKINESFFEAVANDMGKFPEKYKEVKVVERDKIIETLKNVNKYLQENNKLKEENSHLRDTLKLIELILKKRDEIDFDFEDMGNRNDCEGMLEDYELKDVDAFFEKYPYLKVIPYELMWNVLKYYNSEFLCAGWCGCPSLERLLEFLEE